MRYNFHARYFIANLILTLVFACPAWGEETKRKTVQLEPQPAEVFVFGAEISGSTADSPTVLASDKPISGGRDITGWREAQVHGTKCWIAEVPDVREGEWNFRQLFVNGQRRYRPRMPQEGFHRFSDVPDIAPKQGYRPGQKRVQYEPGHFDPAWANRDDIEIVVLHYWVSPRMQIASVDSDNRMIEFTQPTMRRLSDSFNMKQFARYYVDNVFEALTEPGQWYLERSVGRLYYIPMDGETIANTTICAPRLPQLLRIEGTVDKPVENVTLRGLTFTGTEWYDAAGNAADKQASIDVPAVVSLKHARNIRIENCTIRGVGTYAIEIGEGCEGVVIDNCTLTDLGAGGIKIGSGSRRTTVYNCEVSDGGELFHNAIGVWIAHSHDNLIAHNDVHHFYYSAVSVGWTWGYRKPSQASGNVVEFNHLHDIGQGWLSDMAGVYTLGVSPGTIIRNNLVHDIEADHYGGWGLYTDEGSTDIRFENNVVYRTTHGGFHQHYGSYNIIRNNIFAFGGHALVQRTRDEAHTSFVFERNILIGDTTKALDKKWTDDNFRIDHNVYWNTAGEELTFAGKSFADWQKRGHDRHSIVADPMFADPAKGDFTLKPESPAIKSGFKPIDVSKMGRLKTKP